MPELAGEGKVLDLGHGAAKDKAVGAGSVEDRKEGGGEVATGEGSAEKVRNSVEDGIPDATLVGAELSSNGNGEDSKALGHERSASSSSKTPINVEASATSTSASTDQALEDKTRDSTRPVSGGRPLGVEADVVEEEEGQDDDIFNPSYSFPNTNAKRTTFDSEAETNPDRDDHTPAPDRPEATEAEGEGEAFDPRSLLQSPPPIPPTHPLPSTTTSTTQNKTSQSRKPNLNVNVKPPSPQPWDLVTPSELDHMKKRGLSPLPGTPAASHKGTSVNGSRVGFGNMQTA